ncbi:MAG: hypothetical protein J7L04_10555 [Bacteroidales bacterium]|nr:hypothetical protein [Bacteroidales bacterium]
MDWEFSGGRLELMTSKEFEDELAYVFKIKCSKLLSELPYGVVGLQSSEEINKENKEKYGADGDGGHTLPDRK